MSKTLIRVAFASVIVSRDGERASVPPHTPFYFQEDEIKSLEKFDKNLFREATDIEVRGALKFEDLPNRKKSGKRETPDTRVTETANARVTENLDVVPTGKRTREELEPMNKTELTAIAASLDGVEQPVSGTKADIIKAILVAEGVEEDDAL